MILDKIKGIIMNKIKILALSSLLCSSIASASAPCTGLEIKLKNNLADDLLISTLKLNGAEIQPGGIQQINGKTEQVFTVNNSLENVPMTGEFVLHTLSIPSKEVRIQFDLKNAGLVCEHKDNSPDSDFDLSKTRLIGQVQYTINNK